jgi:hypothetical protein
MRAAGFLDAVLADLGCFQNWGVPVWAPGVHQLVQDLQSVEIGPSPAFTAGQLKSAYSPCANSAGGTSVVASWDSFEVVIGNVEACRLTTMACMAMAASAPSSSTACVCQDTVLSGLIT